MILKKSDRTLWKYFDIHISYHSHKKRKEMEIFPFLVTMVLLVYLQL